MTTLIAALTAILSVAGIGVSMWSLISTRNKYFKEYTERKRND
jgi:hypothetical protein